MSHDNAFKPSNPAKRGYNKTLAPFPKYEADPIHIAVRKKSSDEGGHEGPADDRPKWRTTHRKKTVPAPSVVTNIRNLKTEFPSVFRKF